MALSLKEHYQKSVMAHMTKKFGYTNSMQVPKITSVVVNMGVGEAAADKKKLENARNDLEKITGQKPLTTKARRSIAGFKIREGWPIGCKVTLRRERMYDFLSRLIDVSIPRIRDFRGLNPRSFDGRGNFAMGIKEQIVFPEIDYDKIDELRGLDICIVTTAKTNEEALELLKAMNFPFKAPKEKAESQTA